MYLKESQVINVMYDVTEIKPDLSHNTQFVYQVISLFISIVTIHKNLPKPPQPQRFLHKSLIHKLHSQLYGQLSINPILLTLPRHLAQDPLPHHPHILALNHNFKDLST